LIDDAIKSAKSPPQLHVPAIANEVPSKKKKKVNVPVKNTVALQQPVPAQLEVAQPPLNTPVDRRGGCGYAYVTIIRYSVTISTL
jgi:hypothetical protein